MGGHVLESWKEETLRIGHYEKLLEKVRTKVRKGKSVAQIADELEEELPVIEEIYNRILNEDSSTM